ncbi:putative aminopeptidase W07G4.4 isoform X2 [Glandiceps talaboti]
MSTARIQCTIVGSTKCADGQWDGIVLVTDKLDSLGPGLQCLKHPLEELKKIDASVEKDVVIASLGDHPAKRVIFSPTGPLNRDYDDVRSFGDAAGKGIKRALKAGCKTPLLVVPSCDLFKEARLVAALGALHVLYVPLEVRESDATKAAKATKLGIWAESEEESEKVRKLAEGIESGRLVARDVGGSDPERMAAPKVEDYIKELFKDTSISINVISDQAILDEKYPLHAAVDRCARHIDRHRGRIIELEYVGEGTIDTTLMIVGKGVTYDTGGADIKYGGSMAGMHRDKCGAAAVAGFFQTLVVLKPKNIKVLGVMTMVRNSVGADSYVADELITSRAGVRVRIGNTDAEGRMAMADPLCKMREMAANETNPHIYTIATLTGHAIRAMGPNYTIVLDNGPARRTKHAQLLQEAGHVYGEPLEISTIRREDFVFHSGPSEYEDVVQANTQPSSATARGHQSPAAFLIMASGLDKHGIDSKDPLRYSHLDIAGSSGPFPGIPTGTPIVALTAQHLLPRI